jgi:hypothetical protein
MDNLPSSQKVNPLKCYDFEVNLNKVYSVSNTTRCIVNSIAWDKSNIEIRFKVQSEKSRIPTPNDATLNSRRPKQISMKAASSGTLLFDASEFKDEEELNFQYGNGFSKVMLMVKYQAKAKESPAAIFQPSTNFHQFSNLFSTYNEDYKCQIHCIQCDSQEVRLQFEVRGDNSLGVLQHPESSTLNDQHPKRVHLVYSDPESCHLGLLIYPTDSLSNGQKFEFRYGHSGYSSVDLGVTFESSTEAEKSVQLKPVIVSTSRKQLSTYSPEILLYGIKSVYNEDYQCTVQSIAWSSTEIYLKFRVVGDYSLGILQHPRNSRLNEHRPASFKLTTENANHCYEGVLTFSADDFFGGEDLSFSYGDSGYSTVSLKVTAPRVELKESEDDSPAYDQPPEDLEVKEFILREIKSVYNEQYRCVVHSVGWNRAHIFVGFEVHGDHSLGDLQDPVHCQLNGKHPKAVDLITNNVRYCLKGRLIFNAEAFEEGESLEFSYGSGGYSTISLGVIYSSQVDQSSIKKVDESPPAYSPGEEQ